MDLYYSVDRLLPDRPGSCVGDNFGIARLYGLEDAWCEADSGHRAMAAEMLEECTRIASA
jgi:hypothetical protein